MEIAGFGLLLILLIGIALIFDFLNGLHDAANSIATIVSTRVLPANYAVFWAAFFNFIAFLFFGLHVANTVGKGIIHPDIISDAVIFGALGGAITWNVVTWLAGIPSSSSHALIGGLVGAGLAAGGFSTKVVNWGEVEKPIVGIVLAPVLCFILGFLMMVAILWICRSLHPTPLNRAFKKLQLLSSAVYSLYHGGNDAQKTMGVICFLLVGNGYMPASRVENKNYVDSWRAPGEPAPRAPTPAAGDD